MAKAKKKASKKVQRRKPKVKAKARGRCGQSTSSPSAITARKISTRACALTPNTAISASRRRPAAWCRRMSSASFRRSDAEEVSTPHYHDVDFQMVYVLKGWIKSEFEGEGVHTFYAGSCWIQPPRIKHTVLGYSDDCEVLEIVLPADFETVTLAE